MDNGAQGFCLLCFRQKGEDEKGEGLDRAFFSQKEDRPETESPRGPCRTEAVLPRGGRAR